jgi:hypothetical protein
MRVSSSAVIFRCGLGLVSEHGDACASPTPGAMILATALALLALVLLAYYSAAARSILLLS